MSWGNLSRGGKGNGIIHGLGGFTAEINIKISHKGMETGIPAHRDGEWGSEIQLGDGNLVEVKILGEVDKE